ncbi:hypothetical protein RsoM2USA_449 [Ralstonia phage RsoM2USA]|nr:hypothetical protein RsoM2USA_449 [Ralstonia phage RsoM2USA]
MFKKLEKFWKKKFSKTPWFEFIVDEKPDEQGYVKISMDWNDAFIVSIRQMGIFAPTEEEMVEIYLRSTFRGRTPSIDDNPVEMFQPEISVLANGNRINKG